MGACAANWGYDKCLSYGYTASAGGCTTSTTMGMCGMASSGYDCESLKTTNAAYADFSCEDCTEDNCNTKSLHSAGGGGGSDGSGGEDASSALRVTASMWAMMPLLILAQ